MGLRPEIVTSPGNPPAQNRRREHRSARALTSTRVARTSNLPTISVFYGIVIQMYWRDHGPPHFHALYTEHEALIDLRELQVLQGSLPKRAMTLVLEWAAQHKGELAEDWTLCSQLRHPRPIEPLR